MGQAIYSNASLMAQKRNKLKDFDKAREIGIAGNNLFHSEFTLAIHAQRLQEIYDLAIAKFHKSF